MFDYRDINSVLNNVCAMYFILIIANAYERQDKIERVFLSVSLAKSEPYNEVVHEDTA